MPKEPLKVGDRVRIYAGNHTVEGYVTQIKQISANGMIKFQYLSGEVGVAHPKQCRKLVKKPRRRVWILKSTYESECGFSQLTDILLPRDFNGGNPNADPKWIEFVEVKRAT